MSKAIFRATTPEEAELARQRCELAAVREVLGARERELEHLRDQLFSFEGRYIRQVGVLYRQLEEWEERIAELLVSRESPEDRAEKIHKAQEDAIALDATLVTNNTRHFGRMGGGLRFENWLV